MRQLALAQTTALGLRTPSEIVLATDSKTSWTDNKVSLEQELKHPQRKTYQVGDIFVSHAGLRAYRTADFWTHEVAIDSIEEGVTLSKTLPIYERDLKRDLMTVLLRLYREEPDTYLGWVPRTPFLVSTYFARIEAGVPILANITFTLDRGKQIFDDDDALIHVGILADTKIIAEGSNGIARGRVDAIAKYASSRPAGFWHSDPLASAFMQIELEINADPSLVNWPIHAVQITANGSRWFKKSAADDPVEEFNPPPWEL